MQQKIKEEFDDGGEREVTAEEYQDQNFAHLMKSLRFQLIYDKKKKNQTIIKLWHPSLGVSDFFRLFPRAEDQRKPLISALFRLFDSLFVHSPSFSR